MVPTSWYLLLAAMLFAIGASGVLLRRNALVIFMCVELMMNSVNLTFVAFSHELASMTGQVFVFMIMTVAAVEAAVGLAILVELYRHVKSVNVDDFDRVEGLTMTNLIWLTIALPLIGVVINGLVGKKLERDLVGRIGVGMVGVSFVIGILVFLSVPSLPEHRAIVKLWDFITIGSFDVNVSLLVDPLSMIMTLIVTGVGNAHPYLRHRLYGS